MNGAVEATNKNIKKIIKKTTGNSIFSSLWYRSSLANRGGDIILKNVDGNKLRRG